MNMLIAKNPKQLDICLRFLYAEKVEFRVSVCESDIGKIYYEIATITDDKAIKLLQEKYRILIS